MTNVLPQIKPLYDEILAHIEKRGMKPYKFGRESCGNDNIIEHLATGGDVLTGTLDKIRAYLDNNSDKKGE